MATKRRVIQPENEKIPKEDKQTRTNLLQTNANTDQRGGDGLGSQDNVDQIDQWRAASWDYITMVWDIAM